MIVNETIKADDFNSLASLALEPVKDGISLKVAIGQIKEIQDGNPFYESALTLVRAADYALANATTPRDAKDIADRLKGIEAYLSRLSVAKLASNQIVAQRLRIELK